MIAVGLTPPQFTYGLKPFLDSLIDSFVPLCGSEEEVKKSVKFTLTGFSLGAALTDMGTAYLHQKGFNVEGIGMDNPGTGTILQSIHKDLKKEGYPIPEQPMKLQNYILDRSCLFNTLNPQNGDIYVINTTGLTLEETSQGITPIQKILYNAYGINISTATPLFKDSILEAEKQILQKYQSTGEIKLPDSYTQGLMFATDNIEKVVKETEDKLKSLLIINKSNGVSVQGFEKIGHNVSLKEIYQCLDNRINNLPFHITTFDQIDSENMLYSKTTTLQRDYLEQHPKVYKALLIGCTVLCAPIICAGLAAIGFKSQIENTADICSKLVARYKTIVKPQANEEIKQLR